MTTATFSSSRTAGHVVDRDFLYAIEAMLLEIIERHEGHDLRRKAEISFRHGPHGRLNTKGSCVAEALIDATGFADEFKMSIFGSTPQGGPDGDFMISIDLTPDSIDTLYASGPAALACEAHESLRATFEAREALLAKHIEEHNALAAARDPGLWKRVSTNDRSWRRMEAIAPYAFIATYCVLLSLMILVPNRLALPVAGALLAVILTGIRSTYWIPANRKRRRADLEARARAAGIVFPDDEAKPIRLIDMRRRRPGDAERLVYDPAVPLLP